MRHLIVVLALCLFAAIACLAQQSPADQPATKADIDRYYDAMHIRDNMKLMMEAMSKQMHAQTQALIHDEMQKNPNLPPDSEKKMEEMCNKTLDDTLKNFPVDQMLDAMEPVYEKHLTKGDVDALVAFYSTPTGQKLMAEMPSIAAEAMQAVSGITTKYMEQTIQQMQDQVAQMVKNYQPESKTPTATN